MNSKNLIDERALDLIYAVSQSDLESVKVLLDGGVDPNVRDEFGSTPLLIASEKGNIKVLGELIVAGADVNVHNNNGLTPILAAIMANSVEAVRILRSHGAKAKVRDDTGTTPLVEATRRANIEVIRVLLDAKAIPNDRDGKGWTPLLYAADGGHMEAVRLLMQAGAEASVVDCEGTTPLHCAIHCDLPDHEKATLIRELLQAGANPNATDHEGLAPLHYFAQLEFEAETFTVLIQANADPGLAVEIVQPCGRESSTDQSLGDSQGWRSSTGGWTPLHYVGKVDEDTGMVKALVDAGADPDARDERGWTPLHCAVQSYHTDIVIALLRAGANPNLHTRKFNRTPLHLAAHLCDGDTTQALIDGKANIDCVDVDGLTPLDVAEENEFADLVQLMIKADTKLNR